MVYTLSIQIGRNHARLGLQEGGIRPVKTLKTFLVRSVLFLVLALAPELALASTIFDSGPLIFAPVGTQFGRISRDGVPSDWSRPKSFPGVIGAPTDRAYEVITVNSGPFPYLQILFDDSTASLFDAAYLAYTPVNIAPNYGLDVHYLGDPGLSQPFGNPSFFQVVVAPNTNISIVINEVNPGGGLNKPFRLLVEGFYTTDYNETIAQSRAFFPSSLRQWAVLLWELCTGTKDPSLRKS
jgi:hypothetical protein